MGRLEQLRALSFQEWRLLVTALLLLPVLKLSLRGWGFNRVYARLEHTSPIVAGTTWIGSITQVFFHPGKYQRACKHPGPPQFRAERD